MPRRTCILIGALAAALCAAPAAESATRFTIRGAGFGHGVGMSQYGALGYAQHGWDHRRILAHYYTGTGLATLKAPREVRILLASPAGAARFTGATAAGTERLSPTKRYSAVPRAGGRVELRAPGGRALATVAAPLRVTGPQLQVPGVGTYRGALELRPGALGGMNVINAVGLEDYVKGVVALESPASWPAEALKAQAVAARTYAVTTSKGGVGWEHYPDTRSQVYGGIGAEQPTTNAATDATAGQLVTYQGTPVTTYFFSTSGGRTEDVENTSLGTEPRPWLKSVVDQYDAVSPRHRWGPIRMPRARAGAKLRGYVRGRFKGVEVVQRGSSPRIVAADVVGSRGRTRVDGATLRARFGLYDTWAYFTAIKSVPAPPPADPDTGGVTPPTAARVAHGLAGTVLPARRGARVTIERRAGGSWVAIGTAAVGRGGRYHAGVRTAGLYRVRHRGDAGPAVRIG